MHKIVLIRHGESAWNKENRFTGWTDVDLSEKGLAEAKEAGQVLKNEGFVFDLAFTSFLKRASNTLKIILQEMGLESLETKSSWRLNERFYGALQGLNKSETAAKYGEAQVKIWRRSYDVPPPAIDENDERWPGHDPLYGALDKKDIPLTECLKDTVARVVPYWEQEIAPAIMAGRQILIAAHGNSIRAILKHLENMPDQEIAELDIPTGIPMVYELNDDLSPIKRYYLGDPEKIKAATDAVKNQGKAQNTP